MDKAGKAYWDSQWHGSELPPAFDPDSKGVKNHLNRAFHREFSRIPGLGSSSEQRLLEIGCAKSIWLPYFASQFGVRVAGLDYSEKGCELARAMLQREGVEGEIYCRDFFAEPADLAERFDYVVSFGVAEHFEPTSRCIDAFAKFLKPGGILITSVPNMVGLNAALQKALNRPVFDIHVPIGVRQLRTAHEEAGLAVLRCEYFEFLNLGVVNFEGQEDRFWTRPLRKLFSATTLLTWASETRLSLSPNRFTSPHLLCYAKKAVAEP